MPQFIIHVSREWVQTGEMHIEALDAVDAAEIARERLSEDDGIEWEQTRCAGAKHIDAVNLKS